MMCQRCSGTYGSGTGVGKGQTYEKQPNGQWMKIAG